MQRTSQLSHVEQASRLLSNAKQTIGELDQEDINDLLMDNFDWLESEEEAKNLTLAVALFDSDQAHLIAAEYFFGISDHEASENERYDAADRAYDMSLEA